MRASNSSISAFRNRSISLPDMGPFASLIFLLVGFYMLSGHFRWPDEGVVPESQMAYSTPQSGCHLSECCGAVIGLGATNQRSFSTSPLIQATTILIVAQKHGIELTPAQIASLKNLAFLATNVENLAELLSLSEFERNKKLRDQAITPLSECQLMECIATAKEQATQRWHMSLCLYLQIDANTKMRQFEQLTDMLQGLGDNRFKLMTLAKRRSDFN